MLKLEKRKKSKLEDKKNINNKLKLMKYDNLLLKTKNLEKVFFFNILNIFLNIRFFKIKKNNDKFISFYNILVKYMMCKVYMIFSTKIFLKLKKILKNKFLKKEIIKIFNDFNNYNKFVKIFKLIYFKKIKKFLKFKFRLKKWKKKHIYLYRYNILESFLKKKMTKEQLSLKNEKNNYIKKILENKNALMIWYYYFKYRTKKPIKKKFLFVEKNKYLFSFFKKNFIDYIIYNNNKFNKKNLKKKKLYMNLRLNLEENISIKKRKEMEQILYNYFYKNKDRIRWFFKTRKKQFLHKYFLIKKYKNIMLKKKKRTGILLFRKYYSNYYITLTDLSYNVIFCCSAGSVSDSNNKKIKMSYGISIPMFYRILFFLRAFKIRNLKFVFRDKMDKVFFNALNFFKDKGYKIKSFSFVKKAPHHLGQRKQKPRRI